jgi:hypothetical protein
MKIVKRKLTLTHTHTHMLLPSSGLGNFLCGLSIALRKIHVSCALPSQSAKTNMNYKSRLHEAITF